MLGVIVCALETTRRCSRRLAVATAAAAMLPSAPGRFSTTTLLPQASENLLRYQECRPSDRCRRRPKSRRHLHRPLGNFARAPAECVRQCGDRKAGRRGTAARNHGHPRTPFPLFAPATRSFSNIFIDRSGSISACTSAITVYRRPAQSASRPARSLARRTPGTTIVQAARSRPEKPALIGRCTNIPGRRARPASSGGSSPPAAGRA